MHAPYFETSFRNFSFIDFVTYCITSYEPDYTASRVEFQSSSLLINCGLGNGCIPSSMFSFILAITSPIVVIVLWFPSQWYSWHSSPGNSNQESEKATWGIIFSQLQLSYLRENRILLEHIWLLPWSRAWTPCPEACYR